MRKVILLVLASFVTIATDAKKPKTTIKEYFFLLPADALKMDMESIEVRKKVLARNTEGLGLMFEVEEVIDDAKNGYLAIKYGADWGPGTLALAVWRTDKGEDIIGISNGDGSPTFYTQQNGNWKNVTAEVFGDFQKTLFKPKAEWPAHCGAEDSSSSPAEMEFPHGFQCPVPRKGLNITCTYAPKCLVHGSSSVFETDFKRKPTDYYAVTKRQFTWKKNRFVAK
ncbi:MAG: hypothetical protein LDLANPLL_01758 [Turneriella sp.]|nr:hypothetical protein [Turneriella sp.]